MSELSLVGSSGTQLRVSELPDVAIGSFMAFKGTAHVPRPHSLVKGFDQICTYLNLRFSISVSSVLLLNDWYLVCVCGGGGGVSWNYDDFP